MIPGRPVAAYEADPGCAFAPRCAHALPACAEARPAFDGAAACFRSAELTLQGDS